MSLKSIAKETAIPDKLLKHEKIIGEHNFKQGINT